MTSVQPDRHHQGGDYQGRRPVADDLGLVLFKKIDGVPDC